MIVISRRHHLMCRHTEIKKNGKNFKIKCNIKIAPLLPLEATMTSESLTKLLSNDPEN